MLRRIRLSALSRCKITNRYKVDELLRLEGFKVLRLPPYHCDLNPNELMWNIGKNALKSNPQFSIKKVAALAPLAMMTPNSPEQWREVVQRVHKIEDEYLARDLTSEMSKTDSRTFTTAYAMWLADEEGALAVTIDEETDSEGSDELEFASELESEPAQTAPSAGAPHVQ